MAVTIELRITIDGETQTVTIQPQPEAEAPQPPQEPPQGQQRLNIEMQPPRPHLGGHHNYPQTRVPYCSRCGEEGRIAVARLNGRCHVCRRVGATGARFNWNLAYAQRERQVEATLTQAQHRQYLDRQRAAKGWPE